MPAFYDGQQDYIDKLNELYDFFEAGPFNALPITGGTLTGPLTVPTLTVGAGGATGITKAMVGLGNVDNTSDASKPVSSAQNAAIASAIAPLALKTNLGPRNRIDNSNFAVNQRAVSGTVTLAPGAYGHDRWRAGAGGCTYTFSRSQGIVTLTISAGTLLQVIDGASSLQGTNDYVTSWVGTATGRYGTSAYAASGFAITLVADSSQYLEFSTGTLSRVQVEVGTSPTPYEVRNYADEYKRCRWYFRRDIYTSNTIVGVGQAYGTGLAYVQIPTQNDMRPTPTVTITGGLARLGGEVVGAPGSVNLGPSGISFTVAWSSTPFVSGDAVMLAASGTFTLSQNADL